MNTLASNSNDYRNGLVSELGFKALSDAEGFDQVSSISACAAKLGELKSYLVGGGNLVLFVPDREPLSTNKIFEFEDWAKTYFPASLGYLNCYGT
ncbi:hypothetical protein [Rheinheimera sp.]|uniref:hypothetical protein n=1 Tax=Rheinheimera sp. TaxID=1869214 RepID=UPI003D2C4278